MPFPHTQAAPPQKLPVLYLLDSIVKNVGGAYKEEFNKNIVATFMGAYETIRDHNIRTQYLRLLKTWPQHFQPDKVAQIEQMVSASSQRQVPPIQPPTQSWGMAYQSPMMMAPQSQQSYGHAMPTRSPHAGGLPSSLYQQVPPTQQFGQHPTLYPPHGMQPGQPQPQSNVFVNPSFFHRQTPLTQQQQQPILHPSQSPYSLSTGHVQPGFQSNSVFPNGTAGGSSTVRHTPSPVPLSQPPGHISPSPTAPLIPDTSKLMETLKNLGYLGSSNVGRSSPAVGNVPFEGGLVSGVVASRSPSPDSKILGSPETDSMIHSLYDSMTLKCSNCGLRFRSQTKLNHHLDKHFHVQKHRKDNKVLSRKWFQSVDSWIDAVDENVLESPGAILFGSDAKTSPQTLGLGSGLTGEADETENMPIAPADENQDACTICKEKFESYYDSKMDEWLYRDSVKDQESGVIVHRVCYRSLKKRQRADEEDEESQSKRQKIH